MERTLRILARMFEQNGTLYIGAAIAVIVLIVLVTMARRMRVKAATQASADNTVKSPMAADDIELTMIDDAAPSGGDESVVQLLVERGRGAQLDLTDAAGMTALFRACVEGHAGCLAHLLRALVVALRLGPADHAEQNLGARHVGLQARASAHARPAAPLV